MDRSMQGARYRKTRRESAVYPVVPVGGIALALGVLTAYAQGWLPPAVHSISNSSGSWSLVAFASVFFMVRRPGLAAFCGFLSLFMLLVGYVVGASVREYVSGSALMIFWGLAAVLVGPFLGLGAYWLRNSRPMLAALGAGGMSGVLISEGIYGLTYIAASTSPVYWWGQIVVGGAILVSGIVFAMKRELRPSLVAVGVCALISLVFIPLYAWDGLMMAL